MTSEEQRAALAAHEALNRVADDVSAGRIGGARRHTNAPPVAPPQTPQALDPQPERCAASGSRALRYRQRSIMSSRSPISRMRQWPTRARIRRPA